MNYAYHCKTCKKPGIVTCEDEHTHLFQIPKWLSMMVCERCGRFHEANSRHREAVGKSTLTLIRCRQSMAMEKRSGVETRIREVLRTQLDGFCRTVCGFYRVQLVTDDEFVSMVFEKPDKALLTMKIYMNGIRNISNQELKAA